MERESSARKPAAELRKKTRQFASDAEGESTYTFACIAHSISFSPMAISHLHLLRLFCCVCVCACVRGFLCSFSCSLSLSLSLCFCLAAGVWVHAALTYYNNQMYHYINGKLTNLPVACGGSTFRLQADEIWVGNNWMGESAIAYALK
ncbi:MAG TPA: hypothetical protein V6C97_27705 [Oculatellaceae cyanobacterium]